MKIAISTMCKRAPEFEKEATPYCKTKKGAVPNNHDISQDFDTAPNAVDGISML